MMRDSRYFAVMAAISFVFVAYSQAPQRYDNHKLVEVSVKSPAQLAQMLAISEDHWSCAVGLGVVPFRVPPEKMADLEKSGLEYRVVDENIQVMLDAEQASLGRRGAWFTTYHPYDEINTYLSTLEALRPDLALRLTIGQSLENRTLYGIRITGAGGTAGKPGVLFTGCQHAREWAAASTTMFIADQLIRNYDTDAEIRALLDTSVIYIIPIVNPDGYVYTWGPDRLWRKNRRNNGNGTTGVDLNRNWSVGWGLDSGSSSSGSSETYRGTAAFSEPETQVVRNFVIAHPELDAHIDFHTYSQLVLWAWGYQASEPAEPDRSRIRDLGFRMQSAIAATHGITYQAGPASTTLYLASGIAPDYTYQQHGMLSYTIELRPDANAVNGFVLPPEQIIPTGEESLQAALEMIAYVTQPLSYDFPNGLPATVPAETPTTVDVTIRPGTQTLDALSPTVFTREGAVGAFTPASMTLISGTTYRATLPATACGLDVEFYFQAQTTTGTIVRSPADAPLTRHAALAVEQTTLFADDMEIDRGWTVGDVGDNATSGIWNRMNPQGTTAQPEDDQSASGTICWVTDGNAGGSAGANDVDNGKTTLLSPIVASPAGGDPYVSYWRWYSNDSGGSPSSDTFLVDVQVNGGAWVRAETVGPAGAGTSGGWIFHEFRVTDFAASPTSVRVRFVAQDANPGSLVEAAIDEFRVVNRECTQAPPCLGDINGNGFRDLGDLTALLSAFGSSTGDPNFVAGADINSNGSVGLEDLTALLSLFGTPCP